MLSCIPKTNYEMKFSPVYLTPKYLKKYEGISKDQHPLPWTFKDESVYLKTQVVDLHAKTRWK